MSFLAPIFLFGAMLAALPFWLHRLQTQSADRQPFSSAMLLETTEQQIHLRRELKYLLLLALRIALLLLVALIFAKPFLPRPPTLLDPGAAGTHLILVDTSASMSRRDTFAQALQAARDAIDSASAGSALQLLSADDTLHAESALSSDPAIHIAALSTLETSALRLDFGQITASLDRLAETLPHPVTLHLISDFQASALPARFAELASPQIARLIPHVIRSTSADNRSIEYLQQIPGGVEARVSGLRGDDTSDSVELLLNNEVIDQRPLSGGEAAVIRFENLPLQPGDNRVVARLDSNDDLEFDNRRFHVIENVPPAAIPLITLNTDGLPSTYLSAALQADPGVTPALAYRVDPMLIGDFDPRTLSRFPWLLVDDIGAVSSELEATLLAYLDGGGNLLAFAGPRSATIDRLPVSGHRISAASLAAADGFLSIGQVDFGHPLLTETEGWHNVNVSRAVPVEVHNGDKVLLRLDNGEPYLIERQFGRGRLLLLLGGLENRTNDLPLRPVFVSFVIEAAHYLSGIDYLSRHYTAGTMLPLSLTGGASGQVLDPNGNTVLSLADTTRAQQIKLDQPGFYQVYTPQGEFVVAVNVDSREADAATADSAVLQRWTEAMAGETAAAVSGTIETAASPLELWHALLIALLLVTITESMLGNSYFSPRTAK